mmetsp:Transcript_42629/g.75499  ORF Transcript_42629/g.75499 Transcript_42629/m.75499 type:complete len:99 (-) Transcript_42629:839-1135(-)
MGKFARHALPAALRLSKEGTELHFTCSSVAGKIPKCNCVALLARLLLLHPLGKLTILMHDANHIAKCAVFHFLRALECMLDDALRQGTQTAATSLDCS